MATLFDEQSQYQRIVLEGDERHLTLTLDDYFQFDSETEQWYHGFLVTLPGLLAGDLRRVLIMGGGDGLALRDALQLDPGEAWLVELDPRVLELSRRPPIVGMNRGSLLDSRAKVVVADASVAVEKFPDGYFDLIVADFPAATSGELAKLYEPAFYERVLKKLSPAGVFVSQISEQSEFLKEIRLFLGKVLGHSFTLIAMTKRTEMQGFVYGSRLPLQLRRGAPHGSVIAGLAARIDAALREGRKVLTYRAPMRPIAPILRTIPAGVK